jgi:hypothetical protein
VTTARSVNANSVTRLDGPWKWKLTTNWGGPAKRSLSEKVVVNASGE